MNQDEAAVQEAMARVKASEASRDIYKLNLEFTKVISPIDGQVGRYYLTRGNLVNQDQTLLTTVVSLDPMFAYFDMDESTLIRLKKMHNEGRLKRLNERVATALGWLQVPITPLQQLSEIAARDTLPVYMAVGNEEGYPHQGTLDFINNQVNPGTGSISMRGLFANPLPPGGIRLLAPGMSARIRLPIGEPYNALLVIDRAIQSDQGNKFVYVIDDKNTVQYRQVTTGSLQEDGLRVITSGLKPDDVVVVGALQQVRPRMEIRRQDIPMPSLTAQPATDAPEEGPKSPDGKASKGKGSTEGKAPKEKGQ
jgi:multidrug efflux system membrane fusion protein